MNAKEILTFITDAGIVPVVRTSSAEGAIKAVEALYNGGVRAAEITMAALIARLLPPRADERTALARFVRPPLRNWNGREVGLTRPTDMLLPQIESK